MPGRESAAILCAVAAVQAGAPRAAAARDHGVDPGSISRALRRRKLPALRPGRRAHEPAPLPEPYRYADGSPLTPC